MTDTTDSKHIGAYSIRELRALCQKTAPNPEMETYPGRFTRIFSIYTTALLLRTPLSPNQITVLSTVVAFASVSVFFFDPVWWWLSPLLYIFSVILDGSDGEVARFRGLRGGVGALYTEPVSHSIQYGFLFLVMGSALYISHGASGYVVLAAALASSSKLVTRAMQDSFWKVFFQGTDHKQKEAQQSIHRNRPFLYRFFSSLSRNVFSSPGIIIPLVLAVTFGVPEWFLFLYAGGFCALFLIHLSKEMYHLAIASTSV